MNSYEMQAMAFRKVLEKADEKNKAFLEKQIKIMDFLGTCSQDDIYLLYNTGAFNEITEAYCKKAMSNIGMPEKQIKEVREEINKLHDLLLAEEVVN